MLKGLCIQDFAIVDRLDITFSDHINILTGETGAGKSIIIDAVDLSLGGKASLEHIRSGFDEATIEALFELPPESPVLSKLSQMGILKNGESEIIVRRLISRSGRGKVFINGNMMNLATLKDLMDGLVDIHGQHEHQSILNSNKHIDLLDAYGRLLDNRKEYKKLFLKIEHHKRELSKLEENETERKRRKEFINFLIDEITGADVKIGEEEDLLREKRILSNSEKLALLSNAVLQELYESQEPLFSRLQAVKSMLKEIKEVDITIEGIEKTWEEVIVQAKEVALSVRDYSNKIDHDPNRLEQITERLDLIGRLKKKYGGAVEEILDTLSEKKVELDNLNSDEEKIREMKKDLEEVSKKAQELARNLSKERKKFAGRLAAEIEKELSNLKMNKTKFAVAINNKGDLDPNGLDQIEFLISPNPGEEPKPLSAIASGGELSRIMLALKSVLAEVDDVQTLIFDEIDSGIGGGVAEMVGRRLHNLSKNRQVFCITHLPQIASFATNHYHVEKIAEEGRTVTRIRLLDEKERVLEIARMLGGMEITKATIKHAEELLNFRKADIQKDILPGY